MAEMEGEKRLHLTAKKTAEMGGGALSLSPKKKFAESRLLPIVSRIVPYR